METDHGDKSLVHGPLTASQSLFPDLGQTRAPFITAKRAYHGNACRESELGDLIRLHQHGRGEKDAAQSDSRLFQGLGLFQCHIVENPRGGCGITTIIHVEDARLNHLICIAHLASRTRLRTQGAAVVNHMWPFITRLARVV